jgi:O-antigen/teichoic acid export membrane protein
MSVNRAIAHNTAIQMVGKAISTMLGLVAMAMMMRYLPTDQFGWYITTISFLGFIGIIIDFGLIPVTAQMLSAHPERKEVILHNLLALRIVTAGICLLCAPLISFFFPYPIEVHIAIAISCISFFCININQIFIGYFQTKMQMIVPVIGEFVSRITLIIGLTLGIFLSTSFLGIMSVITIASIAYTITMGIVFYKDGVLRLGFDMAIWREIVHKSWPITLAVVFNVLYLRSDTLILSLFRDQVEVGIYGAAYRVIDIIAQTAMMVMGVMLPLLTSAYTKRLTDEFHTRFTQSVSIMALLGLPMVSGLFLLGHDIISFIGGERYTASGDILQILSIAVLGIFFGGIFGHVAVATNNQQRTLWIYAVSAVLTLVGYMVMIPRFGMYGAAWMSVFSEWCTGILLCLVILRITKETIEWRTIIKLCLATIGMSLTIITLKPYLHLLFVIPLAACIYAGLVLSLRVINTETLKELLPKQKTSF